MLVRVTAQPGACLLMKPPEPPLEGSLRPHQCLRVRRGQTLGGCCHLKLVYLPSGCKPNSALPIPEQPELNHRGVKYITQPP